MNARSFTILASVCGGLLLILGVGMMQAEPGGSAGDDYGVFDQDTVARGGETLTQQTGVQAQARGPVHEAFAAPTTDKPQPSPVVAKKPPEAIDEVPPSEKPSGNDVQWIGGYWAWDDERSDFTWISGMWRTVPPARQWVPGHWSQVTDGWQWVAGFWGDTAQSDVKVVPPPPAPVAEAQPPAPNDDSVYVPGTYVYQDDRYAWRPGTWVPYRAGWVWMPAHYVWTPCGYIFVEGYWDYTVQDRGLLFCPVIIEARYLAPGFVYVPTYVVHDVCLMDALFVRPSCGCYFFGDYFAPGYDRLGYVNWCDYRYSRYGSDPLFSYYRVAHRREPSWERSLRGLYTSRRSGDVSRPPRTLAQQVAVASGLRGSAVQRSIMLAPLTRVNHKVVKMQTLDRVAHLQQRKVVEQQRTASKQREVVENRLISKGLAPTSKGAAAQTLSLNLPKTTAIATKTPPPPPSGTQKTNERTTSKVDGSTGTKPSGSANRTVDPKSPKTTTDQGGTKPANNTGTPAGNLPAGTKPTGTVPGGTKVPAKPGPSGPTTGQGGSKAGNTGTPSDTKPGTPTGPNGGTPGTKGRPGGTKPNTNTGTPAGGTPGGSKPQSPTGPTGTSRSGSGTTTSDRGNGERTGRTGGPSTPPPSPAVNPGAGRGSNSNGGTNRSSTDVRIERTSRPPTTFTPPPPPSNLSSERVNRSGGDFNQRNVTIQPSTPRVTTPTPTQFGAPPTPSFNTRSTPSFNSRPTPSFNSQPAPNSGNRSFGSSRSRR